jgi:hypothetical protein
MNMRESIRNAFFCVAMLMTCLALGIVGCGDVPKPPSGPSYAEALAIYKDELAVLDRLKAQRDALAQQLKPQGADVARQLLEQTTDLQKELAGTLKDLSSDTGGAIDADKVDEQQKGLLENVAKQLQNAEQQQAATSKEIEAQIATLDADIAEQQKKVDRAAADKDAAEAARRQ